MTVSSTLSRISFNEDGATTVFPVPYRFLADGDLVVERISAGVVTTLDLATDYTVSGADDPVGGSITRTAAANGAVLRIRRVTPRTQSMAYTVGDDFPAESHERALDRQMLISQEADAGAAETDARALRVPIGKIAKEVPDPAANPGKVLGTGAAGVLAWLNMGGADSALRTDLASLSAGASLVAIIQAGAGAVGRDLMTDAREIRRSPKQYGATGGGVVDDRAAIAAADALGPIRFEEGSYLISSNLTISNDISFVGGGKAKLIIPNGVTVTINGHLTAGIHKIFQCTGTGKVVLGLDKNYLGYAEWWGAIHNDASTGAKNANQAAIGAAIVACPVVQLLSTDYFLASTLKLNTPHRQLQGVGRHWSTANDSTRLVIPGPTIDGVQIGPDAFPGSVASFLQEVHIKDLSIVRDGAPTGNASYPTCPSGLRFQYCLFCSAENIWSTESSVGVMFAGAVQTRVRGVYSFRSLAGGDPANDPFFGFFYDGTANDGFGTGNASVYETDCNTIVGGAPALTISAHSYGYLGYTDWFIERPESTTTQYGIILDATGAGVIASQDISISHSVFDQCLIAGYKIIGGGSQTIINIDNPYIALNTGSTTAVAAIDIESNAGVIDITGGQVLGGLASGTHDVAVKINNSSGVSIRGLLIRECRNPVQVSGSSNCDLSPRINNPTVAASAAAVALSGTNSRIIVAPKISGAAGYFPAGVSMAGTTTTNSTVDVSGIDPAACAGNVELQFNSGTISAAGSYGTTNLAQGNFN